MYFLTVFKLNDLILLGILAHNFGPKYFTECFPYVSVLNLGKIKSAFLRLWLLCCLLERLVIYCGHKLFLALNIKMAIYVLKSSIEGA